MKIITRSFLATALLTPFFGATPSPARTDAQPATPASLVDALHAAFGQHAARAVHAKGTILEGTFTPDAQAATLTKAFHLQDVASMITVRFSNFTGIPDIPDNIPGANPRGFAIKFTTPNGVTTDIVAHSFNGFPTATSDEFQELLLAIAASGPAATKPTALDKFLEGHPIAKTFLTTQKTPASYATIEYYGVNSFQFTNKAGQSHFIRYQFVPTAGAHLLTSEELAKKDPQYLSEEITARVARAPILFKLYAQIAEDGDAIENPSVAWPDQRRQVLLGTIKIDSLASNTPEADQALAFNPGNIPAGIAAADPMIKMRAKAYPISVKERR
ncbi:MAG: catalase family peroxidase [Lacunisphaera sp.]